MTKGGARSVAAEVLVRVAEDGAFAVAVLEAELERSLQLSDRDRALATELVYGTLRVEPWLSAQIDKLASKGTRKLDVRVRAHMMLAAYQLFFMRIPSFAAVNEAVTEIRQIRGGNLAPFANAILRKLAEQAEAAGDVRKEATVASAPGWLLRTLSRSLGKDEARSFLLASAETPSVGIRVLDAAARDEWRSRIVAAAPDAEIALGEVSPHALLARGAGKMQRLPGFADGAWSLQEEGSQAVALALGAAAGETILDACAGRGNKTSLLAAEVGGGGAVDAADLYPAKLERLEAELARQGQRVRRTFAIDWTVGHGDVPLGYDGVLLDAPCSGIGTLRRRPDMLLRRKPASVAELAATQKALLARVSPLVRPSGRLVYAVCSVLRDEAEDVIAAVLATDPLLEPAPFASAPLRAIAGDAPTVRLLPHVHGTDGYFIASFRKLAYPR